MDDNRLANLQRPCINLPNMNEELKDDYNLGALTPVRPVGDEFDMLVTPRFVDVYAHGYETLSTRITRKHLSQKDLFIDVGAHYGYYSLLAVAANPALRGIAIEPVAENLQVLQRNLELNHVDQNRFTCINAAVSSKPGRISFCKSEASDNGSVYPHPSSGTIERIEVATVCLDDVVAQNPASRIFVKTDTDGHELEVFKGFSRTLDSDTDVTILLEMNPKMAKIAGTSAMEICDYLRDKSFALFAIDDHEGLFYPLDKPANVALMDARHESSYYNIIAIRGSQALSVMLFSHSFHLAGAERTLVDLASGLASRRILCTAVLPGTGPLQDRLTDAGCAVVVPSEDTITPDGWWWAGRGQEASRCEMAALQAAVSEELIPIVERISPDVILSQTIVSPWGALVAEALGIPHVLSAREYGEMDHGMTFTLGFKESLQALYQGSDAVFCISEDVKRTLFGEDPEKKTGIVYSNISIPTPVAPPVLPYTPPTPSTNEGRIPSIGIFGTVVESKGQLDLVRACIELARGGMPLRCHIVGVIGDEDYAEAIRREVAQSGFADLVVWTEFVADPYPLMQGMDIVVSCSKREALGRTLLEAALLCRPIVYARSGGPAEIFVLGEHGLAYEPGDSNALAGAIRTVLKNSEDTRARTKRAREYVQSRFASDAFVETILDGLRKAAFLADKSCIRRRAVGGLFLNEGLPVPQMIWTRPKLYYAGGTGEFTEGHTIYAEEMPVGPFAVSFDIPVTGCSRLRFDYTERLPISMTLASARISTGNGDMLAPGEIIVETNGIATGKRSWNFFREDPQLVLKLKRPAARIQLLGETRLLSTASLLEFSKQLNEVTKQQQARVDALEASLSWRLTQPLRWMVESCLGRFMSAGTSRKSVP
jgi:FkbM family methyltransferase